MTITPQDLGRRLRQAREARGLTQEEVAEHLGVPRSSVAQMEAGNRSVGGLELDALARLYGRDIREFVSETFRVEDSLQTLYRAHPELPVEQEMEDALRDGLALAREVTNLEGLLGIKRKAATLAVYDVSDPTRRWDSIQQGEGVAAEERNRLDLGQGPAPDLLELLEGLGIRTAQVEMPDSISGLTLADEDLGVFLAVNRRQPTLRRRFSLAHEYCHALLDRRAGSTVSIAGRRDDLREVRANAFAAAFLMPDEGARQFLDLQGKGSPSRSSVDVYDGDDALRVEGRQTPGAQRIQMYDLVLLAHHFRVSRQAACYRLKNLGYLTQPELEDLLALEREARGEQIARRLALRPLDEEVESRRFLCRFLYLGLEAFRRDQISRAKLAELAAMVGYAQEDLDELLEETELGGQRGAEPLEGG